MFSRSCAAIAAALLLYCSGASAHPSLLSSTPAAEEKLDAAPQLIHLKFNEAVEASFTSVKVVDATGKALVSATAESDPGDPKAVNVPVTVLPSGAYRAQWSAAGNDGHRVKGEFRFSVK